VRTGEWRCTGTQEAWSKARRRRGCASTGARGHWWQALVRGARRERRTGPVACRSGAARVSRRSAGSTGVQRKRTKGAAQATVNAGGGAAHSGDSWPEQEQLGWRASTGRLAGGTGRVDAQELRRWSRAGGAGVEQQRMQMRC
jgi:hypothetical protein